MWKEGGRGARKEGGREGKKERGGCERRGEEGQGEQYIARAHILCLL